MVLCEDSLHISGEVDPMSPVSLDELTQRTQDIFSRIVSHYLEGGSAVGSSLIANQSDMTLSSASIRSIMAELEGAGLLFSPHRSAGRIPTQEGLRLFVDGLMQVRTELTQEEQAQFAGITASQSIGVDQLLEKASLTLSGLSNHASLIMSPTEELSIRHIEFVPVQQNRILVILVYENGRVENRLILRPEAVAQNVLIEAAEFMNRRFKGRTVSEMSADILAEQQQHSAELDELTANLITSGIACWTDGEGGADASLVLNGQSNLLENVKAGEDITRVGVLFDKLKMQDHTSQLLDAVSQADKLQIFIGSDHDLFAETGCAMVLSPYRDSTRQIIGAVGVIGPRHMNYAKIIPMVDYTSKALEKFLS